MDTATHFAMGFGLAGLAYLDPVVASTPGLAEAVMIGTVIGSQAPDLDGLIRIRGTAAYVRNHRGVSHSVPALFLWTGATFALIQTIMPQTSWLHLLGWIFLAVCLHVFVDLFNSYGTKGLYPFRDKWVALNAIFIFDPFIFAAHLVGFMLWAAGLEPGRLFLWIYVIIAVYYYWRCQAQKRTTELVRQRIGKSGTYTIIPTISWSNWTFVAKTEHHWYVGEIHSGEVIILDTFSIKPENERIAAAKKSRKVQSFLSFTHHVHVETTERPFGYEVKWIDLRYRSRFQGKSHYMFVAVVYLGFDLQIRDSFVGWIHRGEDQLTKKMDPNRQLG
ncbi:MULTISPECIES: metal-dependent hydrolase [Brevibacillus]|uniref:metal-dependent hydrolase n=1 Tax=Brevibacillus TaxID=55080 RepID=UPI002602B811|nr:MULTISPECIES: metal-dependent hydrolase [Brevibacillus]MDR7317790.1 inner membrane protein [Brevibacillus nitrificans]MED1794936.1 metal-dependent hydrolase [Brevibacillus nitrificans]MED1950435.1 metal-dependent hydrolase [Brevibacillus centrosporus]